MLQEAIHVNQFLVGFGQRLVSEIPDERMTEQPLPGVNHPAWILGHLALTADGVGEMFGGQKHCPRSGAPFSDRVRSRLRCAATTLQKANCFGHSRNAIIGCENKWRERVPNCFPSHRRIRAPGRRSRP